MSFVQLPNSITNSTVSATPRNTPSVGNAVIHVGGSNSDRTEDFTGPGPDGSGFYIRGINNKVSIRTTPTEREVLSFMFNPGSQSNRAIIQEESSPEATNPLPPPPDIIHVYTLPGQSGNWQVTPTATGYEAIDPQGNTVQAPHPIHIVELQP